MKILMVICISICLQLLQYKITYRFKKFNKINYYYIIRKKIHFKVYYQLVFDTILQRLTMQ